MDELCSFANSRYAGYLQKIVIQPISLYCPKLVFRTCDNHVTAVTTTGFSKLNFSTQTTVFLGTGTSQLISSLILIVTKNGREYLHCEMYPLNKRSTTYARLKRLLKLRSEVCSMKIVF